ncbi:unnamed protein product [Boreogadus saida]
MWLSWKRATLEPLPESSPQPMPCLLSLSGACGAGHRPTSPLPEAFAGLTPQPVMEAGGAGKPGEVAF